MFNVDVCVTPSLCLFQKKNMRLTQCCGILHKFRRISSLSANMVPESLIALSASKVTVSMSLTS